MLAAKKDLCTTHYARKWYRGQNGIPVEPLDVIFKYTKKRLKRCRECGKPRDYSLTDALCRDCYRQNSKEAARRRR